jgi:Domain of unknown function (DUF4167)
MRQGQQNRRGRGRNRKGHQNPLTRSFESNGPDVKIRGTPAHIAEKYISLARDAQASGDPVLAENYLQHAEHYNRIIMAFREQHVQQSGEAMNGGLRHRPQSMDGMDGDDYSDDEGDDLLPDSFNQPSVAYQPAPGQEAQPRNHNEGRSHNEGQRRFGNRPHRPNHDRPMRDQDQGRPMRDQDQGRPMRDRYPQEHRAGNIEREPREPRERERPQPAPPVAEVSAPVESSSPPPAPRNDSPPPRRRERIVQPHEQPEFLRRPVRRPRREANGGDTSEASGAAEAGEAGNQEKN